MLELQNISLKFDQKTILDDISYTFQPGIRYALIGFSGSGKSSLLALLQNDLTPTAGKIILDGLTTKDIGAVFQDNFLFPWQTVEKTIAMPLVLKKWPKADVKSATQKILEEFGLAEHAKKYPEQLSGGQKQRLSLARTVITKPAVILLDEVTSSLDQTTKEAIQDLLLAEQEKNKQTLLIVTHDLEEAAYLAEKVVLLQDGKLIEFDNPTLNIPDQRQNLAFYECTILLRQNLRGSHEENI